MGIWKTALVRIHAFGWLLLCMPVAGIGEEGNGDEPAADAEFLEYLGSWQEGDADWIAVSEWDEGEEQEASVDKLRDGDEQGG